MCLLEWNVRIVKITTTLVEVISFVSYSESRWSNGGVATVGNRIDEYGYTVVDCQSNHLTPFSVLVDVSGAIQVSLCYLNEDPLHVDVHANRMLILESTKPFRLCPI